ncbi:hypothetical protein C5167_034260 [Papaver somniferum]|uniref:WRKY domain-containing protein n=1 Tax=Papaver somniferum TaxID=3469 RepID=A0A4Y7KE00_PAPSO|nr:WRKY transcription factor 22-like [Papaver somniferum]RZC71067.1 hypothetical protein C5167_034260 [Papaver somniferum]
MEEAWDLQAVVSHFPANEPMTTTTATTINQDDSHRQQDPLDFFSPFLSLSDLKELENSQDIYKPSSFCSSSSNYIPSNEAIPGSFYMSTPYLGASAPMHLQQFQQQPQIPKQQLHPSVISSTSSITTSTTTTKSLKPTLKRRKVQQKRLVCKVPAEGVSSDMWAWRKYGQKPIKGSPYPRGYYKCSSSKGCMAKKLVERSYSEPSMFLITYKAEHNHPIPTHRNSLAGSTRHTNNSKPNTSATTSSTSAITSLSAVSSPITHSLMEPSIEAEDNKFRVQPQVKQEIKQEYDHNSNLMSQEELFMGLEVLNGPTMVTTSGSFMRF